MSFDIIRSIGKFQKLSCSLPFDSAVPFNCCIPSQSDHIIHILLNITIQNDCSCLMLCRKKKGSYFIKKLRLL